MISAETRRRDTFDKIDMADKKFWEKETVQPERCETISFFVLPEFGLWFYVIWCVAAAPKPQTGPSQDFFAVSKNLEILSFQQKLKV